MIVMQFTDNFGNMVFGRYNDFYDVADIINSFNWLNDAQAKKWVNSFLKVQSLWKPSKLHMMNGPRFKIWGVPEEPIVKQSKQNTENSRIKLSREEILRRILLYHSDNKLQTQPLKFVIHQYNRQWTVQIVVHPNRQVQYYVTYSLKDGTAKRTEVKLHLTRCIADFPLTKTIEDNIVQVHKALMLNKLLAGQRLDL